jgi:hypothetical protein
MWRSAISANWNYPHQYAISIVKSPTKSPITSNPHQKWHMRGCCTEIRESFWWRRRR